MYRLLLLASTLASSGCGVPQARLDEAIDEKNQAESALQEAQRQIDALTRDTEDANDAMKRLQERTPDCDETSPNFGETSWYHADPVYQTWRERTDIGIDDVDASYKDPVMVERLLRAYHEAFPKITRLESLGQTHTGREILALNITDFSVPDTDKPAVFLNGAHHGHELLSVEYALDAVDQILTGWSRDDARAQGWVRGLDIWVVPVVNPDGLWLTTHLHHGSGGERLGGRKNGRNAPSLCATPDLRIGVDLNRNYPYGWGEAGSSGEPTSWKYRGPSAGSEPETQAIMALARREHFLAAITYHTVGPMVLSPYTLGERQNPDPDVAWAIAEQFAPPGFPVKSSMYPVSGTDQDWLYHEFGTLAYIFEGSRHNPVDAKKRKRAVEKARPAFGALFDILLNGPRLSGRVTNNSGAPVQAVIRVEGYETFHDEGWTSRPDGRFDRMVMDEGRYRVTAVGPDGKTRKSVEVSTGGTGFNIVLEAHGDRHKP